MKLRDMHAPSFPVNRITAAIMGAILLMGSLSVPITAHAAQQDNFTYRLTETWLEGGGGTTTLRVHQSGDMAIARTDENDSLALASRPSTGTIAAGKGSRHLGVGDFPFLIEWMQVPPGLGEGFVISMGNDHYNRIESLGFRLERGDSDRVIEGQNAEHHVLSIDLELRQLSAEGEGEAERATGQADLWIASDLPFSWLPYFSPNGYAWALPHSFNYRDVSAHVLAEISDDLMGLGLLLRSEVNTTTTIGEGGFEMQFIRQVTVEDLQQTTIPLDTTPFDQPVISLEDATTAMGGMMVAGQSCQQGTAAGVGPLDVTADGPSGVSATGDAWLSPDSDQGATSTLVVGSMTGDQISCAVVVTAPGGPEPGEYALEIPRTFEEWKATTEPKAAAYFLRGTRESHRLTVVDSGTLILEATESGKLAATLAGSGWTVDFDPGSPSRTADVAVDFSLSFDAPTPVPPAPAAASAASTTIAAWAPGTFEPSQDQPALEWDFGGQGVKSGAIDRAGKLAAVALRTDPKVVLIDLDSLSELGQIEVEEQAVSDHVSALAFDPAGNRLAIGLPMGTVRIVDTATRETVQELQFSPDGSTFSPVKPLAFDGSGTRVLGYTSGHVVVWDVTSGEELATWSETGAIDDLEVTPDGSRAAEIVVAESLKVLDLSTASEVCVLPGDFSRLAIHPAGDRVATWSFDNGLVVASIDDCSTLATWPTEMKFAPELAWAVDGEHVILGSSQGPLYIYQAATGEKAASWSGQGTASFVYSSASSSRVLSTGMGEESKALVWLNE